MTQHRTILEYETADDPASVTGFDPLEALTAVDADRIKQTVAETSLPPLIRDLADDYDELAGFRDRFLWQWIYASVQPVRLSCVPAHHHDATATGKMLGMLYLCTLDDIADKAGNGRVLEAATRIHSPHVAVDNAALTQLADDAAATDWIDYLQRVWSALEDHVADAPRRDEFMPLLRFDMDAIVMAMKHSRLVNAHPAMLNLAEGLGYGGHNFGYYMLADIDLMYAPEVDCRDLSTLRHIIWPVQHLHRIINWVATWERELHEQDVSAGVFALALDEELTTPGELTAVRTGDKAPDQIHDRLADADLDQRLLDRWDSIYRDAFDTARTAETHSVDLVDYMIGSLKVCQNCLSTGSEK